MSRVLLRLPNWVGDAVMATPALDAIRRHAGPDAQIDAVAAKRSIASLLAEHPALTWTGHLDDPATAARLRATRYDAVVLFPNSLSSAWWALRHVHARARVGWSRPPLRRLFLTHGRRYDRHQWQTPTPRPLSPKSIRRTPSAPAPASPAPPGHMVTYYGILANELSLALGPGHGYHRFDTPAANPLNLPLRADATAKVTDLFNRLPATPPSEFHRRPLLIGLNPGAAYGTAKRYPLPLLAQAAHHLAAALPTPPHFISTAAPDESHLDAEITSHLHDLSTPASPPPILHRLGAQLDLPGLHALLDRLDLLITNDSGAMHLAAARATPTLAIFGPTDWNVTHSWADPTTYALVRESPDCAPCFLRDCPIDHRCMTAITPVRVAESALRLLAANGKLDLPLPPRPAP